MTTPTGVAFMDETGSISQSPLFAVGCLKLEDPSVMLRELIALRSRRNFHSAHGKEFHFTDITRGTVEIYCEALEIVRDSGAEFSCFVADRNQNDPVARFGDQWIAYERLASQLILGSIRRREILTVIADNYSTPSTVLFEQGVASEVNNRLGGRLGVANVFRIDSRASDGIQMTDLLLGAVAYEYRLALGLAKPGSLKANFSERVRGIFGLSAFDAETASARPFKVCVYGNSATPVPPGRSTVAE